MEALVVIREAQDIGEFHSRNIRGVLRSWGWELTLEAYPTKHGSESSIQLHIERLGSSRTTSVEAAVPSSAIHVVLTSTNLWRRGSRMLRVRGRE